MYFEPRGVANYLCNAFWLGFISSVFEALRPGRRRQWKCLVDHGAQALLQRVQWEGAA